jgi:hypothetical protein
MKLEDEEEEEVEEDNSGIDSTNTGTSEKVKYHLLCVLDSKQAIWCLWKSYVNTPCVQLMVFVSVLLRVFLHGNACVQLQCCYIRSLCSCL